MKTKKTAESIPAGDRLTSGVAGLDTLLMGGFVRGGVYLLLGPPGSGKTILGNQICFHHAEQAGGSVVYVTLLAESHSRMMGNLRTLDYFDDDKVARSVHYLSGYRALEQDGLKGLLLLIAGIVREKKATVLMIDGITTIGDMDQSPIAFRKFTHELNSYVAASGCTAFLLSSMEGLHSNPEHTMVDGILALHHRNAGLRASRQVEVRKFRGSDHLQGKHYFSISDEGIRVFPRIESLVPEYVNPRRSMKRISMGVEGLDDMLGGGVLTNSVTTLIGSAGTGKTIMGLHFLTAGAEVGEQGLFFGFYERPDDLAEKAQSLNLRFPEHVKAGRIDVLWHPALELELDQLGDALLKSVREKQAKRVFIDGVDAFRYSTSHGSRLNRFFVALIMRLKAIGVTVLLVEETALFRGSERRQIAELSALNENLLFLQHVIARGKFIRSISVLKIRNAVYDPHARELHIDDTGVQVRKLRLRPGKLK